MGLESQNTGDRPLLEEDCGTCGGTGQTHGSRCARCDGVGLCPTEFGEAVLSLIAHNISRVGR